VCYCDLPGFRLCVWCSFGVLIVSGGVVLMIWVFRLSITCTLHSADVALGVLACLFQLCRFWCCLLRDVNVLYYLGVLFC